MEPALVICVGVCALFAGCWLKLRKIRARKVELERRIEDLLTISDNLNRTQGRRAHKITMRNASIGEIVRSMPASEPEQEVY